jgi:hypothetical protein
VRGVKRWRKADEHPTVVTTTMSRVRLVRAREQYVMLHRVACGSTQRSTEDRRCYDEGFRNVFLAYERSSDGAVVMTNSDAGEELANEIMHSIADEYGWPDYHSTARVVLRIDPKSSAGYVGTFELRTAGCQRKIFTEPLPGTVARYARRSCRSSEVLHWLTLALGERPGARLVRRLGLLACRSTQLHLDHPILRAKTD